jgi:general secretion pathway protein G
VNNRNKAFTLIEILIVVLILAILAAIVIPQFTNAAEESKLSNLMSNLQSIRAQLELYKMHHNEDYPTDPNAQLTQKTDSDGTINPAGAYGPYLHLFPGNPFIDDAAKAVLTTGAAGDGWNYNAATGVILPNTAGHAGL